jgi:hypothetical protein
MVFLSPVRHRIILQLGGDYFFPEPFHAFIHESLSPPIPYNLTQYNKQTKNKNKTNSMV